jgi:hypothetical protein
MPDLVGPQKKTDASAAGPVAAGTTPAAAGGIRESLKGLPYQQQVEALKPPPDATGKPTPSGTPTTAAPPEVTLQALAESLVDAKGSAGAADKAAVVAEVVKIPRPGLEALVAKKTRITVCRGSVTEVLTNLKGVAPRGWPPGMTWDIVPGLFDSATNQVIIATKGGKVPATGDGHGSANLVIHEVGHAIDGATGGSNAPEFVAAYNQDKSALPAYEQQDGAAGREEAYAESMARYHGGGNDKTGPNLSAYWKSDPLKKP